MPFHRQLAAHPFPGPPSACVPAACGSFAEVHPTPVGWEHSSKRLVEIGRLFQPLLEPTCLCDYCRSDGSTAPQNGTYWNTQVS